MTKAMITAVLLLMTAGCGEAHGPDARTLGRGLHTGSPNERVHAAIALERLGRRAAPALEDMVSYLESPDATETAGDQIVMALGNIGPAAASSVPALVKFSARTRSTFGPTQVVRSLGRIGAEPQLAVPCIVELLDRGLVQVFVAGRALASFGAEARGGVSAILRQLRRQEISGIDEVELLSALAAVGPDARDAVPLLTRRVGDPDRDGEELLATVNALRAIGEAARASLPALRELQAKLLADGREPVLRQAVNETIASIER